MDVSAVLKAMAPVVEPILEQAVSQYWPELDKAISLMEQADAKMVLEALSPVLKDLLIKELKAHLS